MKVEIDAHSGFCFGVAKAIEMAEFHLKQDGTLYCLGNLVHNTVEMERLKNLGLIVINHDAYRKLSDCKVLIRAHGEPPETYDLALANHIELIDASCPIVLRLQEKVKKSCFELKLSEGQVVLYGKKGHPEINGLLGQSGGKAFVVSEIRDLDQLDYTKPIHLYSQTTKSPVGFKEIEKEIERRLKKEYPDGNYIFASNNTVCGQVSGRDKRLKEFATKHDVIVFVSGKESSNGKMLYGVCKNVNALSYFISEEAELVPDWFRNASSVGVCGATSTPRWMMEKVAASIAAIKY